MWAGVVCGNAKSKRGKVPRTCESIAHLVRVVTFRRLFRNHVTAEGALGGLRAKQRVDYLAELLRRLLHASQRVLASACSRAVLLTEARARERRTTRNWANARYRRDGPNACAEGGTQAEHERRPSGRRARVSPMRTSANHLHCHGASVCSSQREGTCGVCHGSGLGHREVVEPRPCQSWLSRGLCGSQRAERGRLCRCLPGVWRARKLVRNGRR